MAENEVKLAYFQDISRSKSRQLDMVCTMWCVVALCGAMHAGEFEEKKKCLNWLCFLNLQNWNFSGQRRWIIHRRSTVRVIYTKVHAKYFISPRPLENSSRSRQREASCDQTPAQTLHELYVVSLLLIKLGHALSACILTRSFTYCMYAKHSFHAAFSYASNALRIVHPWMEGRLTIWKAVMEWQMIAALKRAR